MKSVYFAARYSRLEELNGYRAELEALGFEVTSRWMESTVSRYLDGMDEERQALAMIDQEDVLAADVLVCFSEPSGNGGNGGRHVELGMALALGRSVIVVGAREHIFHWLPEVMVAESWPEARRLLVQQLDTAAVR